MSKTILITGSTDGIGLDTAKKLIKDGHRLLIHGRDQQKLDSAKEVLASLCSTPVKTYLADLSNIDDVKKLAKNIKEENKKIDVLINNAGVYKTPTPITNDNLDIRFVVNTIAPYLLIKELMELFDTNSRIINLSSAAQAPVSLEALAGERSLSDSEAYAQSKLALTMWNSYLSSSLKEKVGVMVAINPASFLGSKMVKEAYGMSGKDLGIGSDILVRAALSDEFRDANGKYFDNDIEEFALAHSDVYDLEKCGSLVNGIERVLSRF